MKKDLAQPVRFIDEEGDACLLRTSDLVNSDANALGCFFQGGPFFINPLIPSGILDDDAVARDIQGSSLTYSFPFCVFSYPRSVAV